MHWFAPRPIEFHGLHHVDGWRLKRYSVCYSEESIDWKSFAPGLAMAEASLPRPAVAEGRPGVGLVIAHRGRTGDYFVLAWWDRENELPLRVFVSPERSVEGWRPSQASESVCVWDLEILWRERELYVSTVLNPASGDVAQYLALRFDPSAPSG